MNLLEKNWLDEDVSVTLLELTTKTWDSQIYKRHDITSLSYKSGKAQYEEGQRNKKNEKNKRDGKNRKGERGRKNHYGNKINLVVEENGSFKISVLYHIIYWCYQEPMVLG